MKELFANGGYVGQSGNNASLNVDHSRNVKKYGMKLVAGLVQAIVADHVAKENKTKNGVSGSPRIPLYVARVPF